MPPTSPLIPPPVNPALNPQLGMQNPFVPPVPPPPSPSLGFQLWAQAPQNAMKVQPSMTPPQQPLQPNANAPMMAAANPPSLPSTPAPSLTVPNKPQMAAANPPQIQSPLIPPSIPGAPPALPTPPPSFPSLPPPVVQSGAQAQLGKDMADYQRKKDSGAGVDQIKNKPLRVLGKIGDIAASVLAPGVSTFLPGTTLHHDALLNRSANAIGRDQEAITSQQQGLKSLSDLADTQSQTQLRVAQAKKADEQANSYAPVVVSSEQAQAIGFPEFAGSSMDPRHLSALMQKKQTTDAQITVGAGHDAARLSISQMKPKQRDDQYIQIMSKPTDQRTPDDLAFKQGYEAMINTKTTQPGIARAAAFANARPVQVVDPNSNNVVYQTAGNAIKTGAATPQSSDYAAGKSLEKSFTSGEGAKNLNAFNTASAHLETLGKAAKALHNGDVQALNRIGNEWAKQTGGPAPQNFEAVKAAVAGEVSKTFKGGQATDAEIKEFNGAISSASSPAQLLGVISTYQDLMGSKREALQQQYEMGRQGKPNFGGNAMVPPPIKDGVTKKNAAGDTVVFRKGAWGPA